MIVCSIDSGWEIIFQSAHALLASQIAAQLKQLPRISYWAETLAAIADHDDHKESFGSNVYLTDLGAPKDFTQVQFTSQERLREVQRRIEHGYRKHRWLGLLAGRHAEELYREVKVSQRLGKLLQAEQQRRPSLLKELKTTVAALEAAYAVLQWCDRTSLILCQSGIPAMHRRIEIAPLADQRRYQLWQAEDETVAVSPWPFQSHHFEVHVEVRALHQLTFQTDRELQRGLESCEIEDRRWTFQHPETR